jgi:hypothetical protein
MQSDAIDDFLRLPITNRRHPDHFAMKRLRTAVNSSAYKDAFRPLDTARTLLAVTDRPFGTMATDFEQFTPRGWSVAARDIVGEVRRR